VLPDRYIVDVKLTGQHFQPGQRYYKRVVDCLSKCEREITFWLLAAEVEGLDWFKESVRYEECRLPRMMVPDPPLRDISSAFWADHSNLQRLFDWVGSVSLDVRGACPFSYLVD